VLKSLDVLIGLTVVLLALSMAVTVITQSITTLFNSRGRHLRRGLTDLLQQLDPGLTPALSKSIASAVLTHPLVSGSSVPFTPTAAQGPLASAANWVRRLAGGPRYGNVVHREEFTKLLMAAAAGQGTSELEQTAKTALATALANNGVAHPDAALKHIRVVALQLERTSPELSNMARQNLAILHAAESDFVAKINNWFDQTMDRTSQRFTASTRAITFAGAFIVAFGLQVDTPALVNRLAADDALRNAFVQEAETLYKNSPELQAAEQKRADAAEAAKKAAAATATTAGEGTAATTAASTSGGAQPPAAAAVPAPTDPAEISRKYRAFLAEHGIITLPSTAGWAARFREVNVFGLLVTALLLSLGAPFWYSALGRLLQLRSVLAAKDDAQRAQRQTSEPPAPKAEPARAAAAFAGERGDLAAIG
jgi:hypothetical protein